MKIEVIIEKGKKEFWGRIEGYNFLPVTAGKTVGEVLDNLRLQIEDYIEHEGKSDNAWKKVDPAEIEFDVHYDVQSFFVEHNYLNVSSVAKVAEINPSLLRQYASGVKYPSPKQALKIESAVRSIGERMRNVSLHKAGNKKLQDTI